MYFKAVWFQIKVFNNKSSEKPKNYLLPPIAFYYRNSLKKNFRVKLFTLFKNWTKCANFIDSKLDGMRPIHSKLTVLSISLEIVWCASANCLNFWTDPLHQEQKSSFSFFKSKSLRVRGHESLSPPGLNLQEGTRISDLKPRKFGRVMSKESSTWWQF